MRVGVEEVVAAGLLPRRLALLASGAVEERPRVPDLAEGVPLPRALVVVALPLAVVLLHADYEAAPLALRLRLAVLLAWRTRADRLGMRRALDPHGHVHVQAAAPLLLVAVPRAHDVAERGDTPEEALVELFPALVIVPRGLDWACPERSAAARGGQVPPAHLVGGEGEEEVRSAVLGCHRHDLRR